MNFSEIAVMTGETLLTTLLCTALAYLAGLPCGVLLCVTSKNGIAPRRVPHFLLSAVVNLLRSVPCLIFIVLCMPVTRVWFGKGTGEWYTVLLPLTLSAFGFVARMAEQSLSEVPAGEIEAVKSLGATNFQLIVKVLLPEAKPSLISGAAVTSVTVLGYTSFAYNVGAGGLIAGIYTFYSRNTGNYAAQGVFWLLVFLVVILVFLLQEAGLKIAKKSDKRRR